MKTNLQLAALLIFLAGPASAQEAVSPPAPEKYLQQERPAEFVRLAKEYLAAQPKGEDAPQVAWDLCQVVSVAFDRNEWYASRLRLLADYPDSLPARYVRSQMSKSDYVEFLTNCFGRLDLKSDPRGLERFRELAEQEISKSWSPSKEPELMLEAALATSDKKRKKALLDQLESQGHDTFRSALAPGKSPRERFELLQSLGELEPASALQWIIYQTELSPEDRADPTLVVPVASHLHAQDRPDLAAQVLAAADSKYSWPSYLYRWALADAAAGNTQRASETLRRLVKNSVGKEREASWARSAETLLPVFADLDKNQASLTKMVGDLADSVARTPPEVIEIVVDGDAPEVGKFSAYLACDTRKELLEGSVSAAGNVICALKTSPEDNRSYFSEAGRIRRYEKRAYPTPSASWVTLPSGRDKISAAMTFPSNRNARFRHFLESRLSAPAMTPASRNRFLSELWRAGVVFPGPAKSVDGERIVPLYFANGNESGVGTAELRLAGTSRLTVASDEVTIVIRMGRSGQFALHPPAWPEAPVDKVEEFDGMEVTRFLGAILELAQRVVPDEE
jgi:hypothetical protein